MQVLQLLDSYLDSVRDPISLKKDLKKRATRHNGSVSHTTDRPYVPAKVWAECTWEDWAQLSPGDILHVPFNTDETIAMTKLVKRLTKVGSELNIWEHIANFLPGRSAQDCKCFWADYQSGLSDMKKKTIMIRELKGNVYICVCMDWSYRCTY